MAQHVAIKCTYNNADEGKLVGFNGTCTEDIIKSNIENGRIWCSQNDCGCKQYYDMDFKGDKPKDQCYESRLFRDWEYGAGWCHTGKRAGIPIHFRQVQEGKIVLLTTRFPNDIEIDRKIIGIFKIDNVINKPDEETILKGNNKSGVRLSMEDARELYFWNYYSNTNGGANWGHGLNRYINENIMHRILFDLRKILHSEKDRRIVDDIISSDFSDVEPLPASGARIS